jgi:ribosomal protein L7/L12
LLAAGLPAMMDPIDVPDDLNGTVSFSATRIMDISIALVLIAAAFLLGYTLGGRGRRETHAPSAPLDSAALELARPILEGEGKIAAIRAYREATGVGLREGKMAVETLENSEL